MNYKLNFKKYNLYDYGYIAFSLGIFFLPTAFFFSCIFFLISLLISTYFSGNILKEKYNYPFLITGLMMVLVFIISSIPKFSPDLIEWDITLNFLGLLNWLPFFLAFYGFQIYLRSESQRERCAGLLIAGTVPIVISGLGQYFLGWYGPYEAFNGLLIWYQRSIESRGYNALTGPFNNQNYTGAWLATVIPFCIFYIKKYTKVPYKKNILLTYFSILILSIFLSHSRNAIIGIFSIIPILLLKGFKAWSLFSLVLIILTFSVFIFEIPAELLNYLRRNKILESFLPQSNINFHDIFSFRRIILWKNSLTNIFNRPLLGWGTSSFSIIYMLQNKGEKLPHTHTHNLFIEVAHNYGFITAFILIFAIFRLIFSTNKIIFSNKYKSLNLFDINKIWWTACFIIVFMQFSDITYYDGRISILFWLLISGLRSIENSKSLHMN